MTSRITEEFRALFAQLPAEIQARARRSYRLWQEDATHPSLHFKKVHSKEAIYSVRIGRRWRALGLLEEDTIYWFWIGSHSDYDGVID